MYNFKSLTGSTKFLSYKDWKIDDFVIGKVLRLTPNKLSPKFQDVVISVLESNIQNEKLSLSSHDVFTVNGTTALEKALQMGVEEGDIIKVTYKGKEANKTGPYKGVLSNRLDVQVSPAQDQDKVVKKSVPTPELDSDEDEVL